MLRGNDATLLASSLVRVYVCVCSDTSSSGLSDILSGMCSSLTCVLTYLLARTSDICSRMKSGMCCMARPLFGYAF